MAARDALLLIIAGGAYFYFTRKAGGAPIMPGQKPSGPQPTTPSSPLPASAAVKPRYLGPKQLSSSGVAALKYSEGLRLASYQDVAGKWTIGYGHLIVPGDGLSSSSRITEPQAQSLLARDAGSAVSVVNAGVKVPLSQSEFDALVNLTYNIGAGAFMNSTLLRLLNQGNYAGAEDQFGVWIYSGGKPVSGLQSRRAREAAMFSL